MFIDTRRAPEVARLIALAAGYHKAHEAEVRAFAGPMTLTSHWNGGSIDHWTLVEIATGRRQTAPESGTLWTPAAPTLDVLPPGYALVQCQMFRGKAMTPRVYVHTDTLNRLAIPATPVLSEDEQRIVDCTCTYKSAYRRERLASRGLAYGSDRYERAKARLVQLGLLNAAGAITPAGRNARSSRPEWEL